MIDRGLNVIAIKPSGVPYDLMKEEDIVICDLNGNVIDGKLKPSTDLHTHIELYKAFKEIGGVCHTHSSYATSFAQARKEIPVLGTTHADYFSTVIPCARELNESEMDEYEKNTGKVIVETFNNYNYNETQGCLVSCHGVFTWGKDADDALTNAVVLEEVAKMAHLTLALGQKEELPLHIKNKHYERKHGKNAYYGQKNKNGN